MNLNFINQEFNRLSRIEDYITFEFEPKSNLKIGKRNIKYLDFISPPITFHHKGHLSHFSVVSGIISIISFVIIFIIAIQFSLEIIKRKNPAAYYFNTFTKDAGIFPLNSSSLFHFISIAQNTSNLVDN